MQVTFLGHQGWLVEFPGFRALVDPILTPYFRNSRYSRAWVNPPRGIDVGRMGPIDAVVFTHEHEDHFHVESLHQLARGTKVWIGANFSEAGERIIREMGFCSPERLFPGRPRPLGRSAVLVPFAPPPSRHEHSAVQLLFCGNSDRESFFDPVDCGLPPEFISWARSAGGGPIGLIALPNNSQSPSSFGYTREIGQSVGSPVLKNFEPANVLRIHLEFLSAVPAVRALAVVGGGFVDETSPFGLYRCACQRRLAEILMEYSYGEIDVFGPGPGDTIIVERDRVRRHPAGPGGLAIQSKAAENALLVAGARAREFSDGRGYGPVTGRPRLEQEELDRLAQHLVRLGALLGCSPLHQELMQRRHSSNGGPTREGKLLLVLRNGREESAWSPMGYEYRPHRCSFERVAIGGEREWPAQYPYGFECWASDLLGLFEGEVYVYELLKYRCRQWTHGLSPREHSLRDTLQFVFAPEAQPEATYRMYRDAYDGCLRAEQTST